MDEAFLIVFRILGFNSDGHDGTCCTTDELVAQMRNDPVYLVEQRSFWEHVWSTTNRSQTQLVAELLVASARYLSNLVGGDVPVLLPRKDVEGSAGIGRADDQEAERLGKSLQRVIESQIRGHVAARDGELLAQFETILTGFQNAALNQQAPVRSPGKYLNAAGMADHLGVSAKTIRRACRDGQIDADKTKGGQWRTTLVRLEKSPYLNGKRYRKGGAAHAKMEP